MRRLLRVGYWVLVVFAFAYSAYCYFYPKGFSSERSDSVSQARRQVDEASNATQVSLPAEDSPSAPPTRRRENESPDAAPVSRSVVPQTVTQDRGSADVSDVALEERRPDEESTEREQTLTAVSATNDFEVAETDFPDATDIFPFVKDLISLRYIDPSTSNDSHEIASENSSSSISAIASERAAEISPVSYETRRGESAKPSESKAKDVQKKEEVDFELGLISISKIRIGYRTAGTNPEGGGGADESVFEREPHYIVTLKLAKEDGSYCTARLLRSWRWLMQVPMRERRVTDDHEIDAVDEAIEELNPYSWLERRAVDVWLDLASFGCEGWAEVVEVKRFNEYRPGPGNLVTGTFEHTVDNVVDLYVEDQDKPIGCTPSHPFWSADREEFVEAGELAYGERVTLINGETKRVLQRLPRPGSEKVYNLEVFGEHVYHVTSAGILVHNDCVYVAFGANGEISYVGRTNNFLRRKAEHWKRSRRVIYEIPGFENLTPDNARVVEDLLIRGLEIKRLDNIRNGLSDARREQAVFKNLRNQWKWLFEWRYGISIEGNGAIGRSIPTDIDKAIRNLFL